MGPVNELIPRRVVLAIVAQLSLLLVDLLSLLTVIFAVVGMTHSTEPVRDPAVDAVLRSLVVGYGLSSTLGFGSGIAASVGLFRGASWGRTLAMIHGFVSILSCCPCNWIVATLAIVAALHEDVRAWPKMPARDLAETFR